MVGGSKSRPYWTFACESCMRCMGYCPNKAVEVSHVSREYSIIALTQLPAEHGSNPCYISLLHFNSGTTISYPSATGFS